MVAPGTKPCDNPWPPGLRWGQLIECDRLVREYSIGHTGKHSNHEERISWWGAKLTDDERELARQIRNGEGSHLRLQYLRSLADGSSE